MSDLFPILTQDETAEIAAKYLPLGKAWFAKDIKTTNFYKFLKGGAQEFNNIRAKLNEVICEFNANVTTEYIEEWETAVGIPDGCFNTTVSIEQRRRQVVAKLKAIGVQTAQDLIDVIAELGVEINVETGFGLSAFPVTFPWPFYGNENTSSNTIIITYLNIIENNTFPVDFPWIFGGSSYITAISCFILTLVPATDVVYFKFSDKLIIEFLMQDGDQFLMQNDDEFIMN
jgi:hypothetical protein